MADPIIIEIEDGAFALAVVNKAAVGYTDAWQAPGGKQANAVLASDYATDGGGWRCQVTKGVITSSASTTTKTKPATFCSPAEEVPNPGKTTYSLDLSFLQDPTVKTGLSAFLFENDIKEAYFMVGLDGANPPKAIGRLVLQAGNFGGTAGDNLTADVSLRLSGKPDIAFGTAATGIRVIKGDGNVTVIAGTSGISTLDGGGPADDAQRVSIDGGSPAKTGD